MEEKIIKISHPYTDATTHRQTPRSKAKWKNYTFKINDDADTCDYWVILNTLPEIQSVKCIKRHTLLWTGEPYSVHKYNPHFVKQFDGVITSQKEIDHPYLILSQQGNPWFVNKDYDELKSMSGINKTKKLSVITSNKQFTEGHKKRYEFCMKLKEFFGEEIDIFGRGINDFEDKWDTLAPYEYSVAIENSVHEDYFTEKLSDCYLAYTFPIYYGCPNIDKYFDKNAYLEIDINDVDKSIRAINQILSEENGYNKRLESIKKARDHCLDKYNFFQILVDYFETNKFMNETKIVHITLKPEVYFDKIKPNKYISKIKQIARNVIRK